MEDRSSDIGSQTVGLLNGHRDSIAQEEAHKKNKRDGILTLIGGVCIHLVLGNIYLWGSISVYVASYLHSSDSSIDTTLLTGIFPFIILGQNVGLILSLPAAEKFGFRPVFIASVFVIGIVVFATSFVKSFALFVLVYGIIFGISLGMLYMLPIVCGWKYFPNNKGLVSGTNVGAYAFGSFIFNFVTTAVVNPRDLSVNSDKYFGPEVYNRVPLMFRIMSLCFLLLGLLGSTIIRIKKRGVIKEESQLEEDSPTTVVCCGSVMNGLKSQNFWMLFFIAYFSTFFGLFMSNNYKVYGLINIKDDQFITLIGSLGSICNGLSRPIWAILFDKYGFKKAFTVLLVLQAVLSATLDTISTNKWLYMIWFCALMSCEGGNFAILPAATAKLLGLKYAAKIYPGVFFAFSLGSFTSFFLVKYGLKSMGWNAFFWFGFGFTVIALVLNTIFKEEPYRKTVKE